MIDTWIYQRSWSLYIGGQAETGSSTQRSEIGNPATGDVLCTVPVAESADVDHALSCAKGAFLQWREEPLDVRLATIETCRLVVLEHAEELAALDAISCGNPIRACRADVARAASGLTRLMGAARSLRGETVAAGKRSEFHLTRWEPYGVVAMIVPFNHPTYFAVHALAAIATGNTVVLKPSEQSPLSALRLAELLGQTLPPGVLNVLTGPGQPTGTALVSHPSTDLVYFIGSSPVGRAILRQSAMTRVRPTVLELGGKNPMIVCADVDVDEVAKAAVVGLALEKSQGQSCNSTSRILIEAPIYDKLVTAISARFEKIGLGDPLQDDTMMGPVVSKAQQARILGQVQAAVAEGAQVLTGGCAPTTEPLSWGAYVEPTLLGVRPEMAIAREEVFGPVLCALSWNTDDEAIEIANSVEYGLTAAIWTDNIRRAQYIAGRLDSAQIYVNSKNRSAHGLSADTWKESGIGLTGDWASALTNFVHTKGIHFG